MKKVTIASTALAASICLGTQSAMAAGSLHDKDMLFAFGAESSVNTMILSEQEMVETEGELFIVGAIFGLLAYVTYSAVADESWDAGDAISWSAAGATGGVGGFVAQQAAKGAISSVIAPMGASAVSSGLGYGVSESIQTGNNTNFGYQHPGNEGFGPGW